MSIALLLAAALRIILPAGTMEQPAAVVPLTPTSEPIAFWWNDEALSVGGRPYAWKTLGVTPRDGASFKVTVPGPGNEQTEIQGAIDLGAPRIRMKSFGTLGNTPVSNRIEIVANRDIRLTSRLFMSGMTPDYLMNRPTKTFKAGTRGFFEPTGRSPSSGECYYAIFDEKGRIYYHINCNYHDPKLVFDFKYLWAEPEKQKLHVNTWGWAKAEAGYALRLTMKDLLSDTLTAWQRTAPVGAIDGERDYAFDVSTLPSGFYWAHIDYLDRAGRVIHSDKARLVKPNEKMPWDDTPLGCEDTVPPPWSAPEFAKDGTFKAWNRAVRLGGKGLVSSIVNGGHEMLTAPVSLALDGQVLTFDVAPAMLRKSQGRYRLKAREADVEASVTCEFDGYMRFDVTYPAHVHSLVCRVPVSRKLVKGFDDCSSEGNMDIIIPPGKEVTRFYNPDDKPIWWMPGPVGLLGGALNLHGWHVKDLAHAQKLEAKGDTLSVGVTFVDTPPPPDAPRTVSFYLEPTPAKPKNLKLASVDADRIVGWTGHLCQYFEIKYPGFDDPLRFKPYLDDLKRGKCVLFYNATRGESPESPFWNWYRRDWNLYGIDDFAHEAPLFTPSLRQHNNWVDGCVRSKSFLEHKIWGVNWYLNDISPAIKDLYFDLANPKQCRNPAHACTWKDAFGRTHHDWSTAELREMHKRAYRLVKAKNKDGILYGHIGSRRYPGDVFFDMISTGESLASRVLVNFNYFDVYTPEMMQSYFVPRAQEMVLVTPPQLRRARECWAPDLLKTYSPFTPENERAIRHCAAYIKIHDLNINRRSDHPEGPQFYKVDTPIRQLGASRLYSAYFHEGEPPVRVSAPHPRFLWSWHRNARRGVLILLNDTDAPMTERVSIEGLQAKGREILDGTPFDFTSGSCTLTLPARGAVFIAFDTLARNQGVLRLGALSDLHIGLYDGFTLKNFEKALRAYDRWGADAVLCCGDLTDLGYLKQLEAVSKTWFKVFPGNRRSDGAPIVPLFIYGDHDMSGEKYSSMPSERKRFASEEARQAAIITYANRKAVWERLFHERFAPIMTTDVKGRTFVRAHFTKGEPGNPSGDNVPGLEAFLTEQSFGSNSRFFFLQHRVPRGTAGGATIFGQDDGSTTRLLSRYPNAFAFCGHAHFCCTDARCLWQGAFSCLEIPSLRYCTTDAGHENGYNPGDRAHKASFRTMPEFPAHWKKNDPASGAHQGYFIELAEDDAMRVRRWDFLHDRRMGADWFSPKREKDVAPSFPTGARVTLGRERGRDRGGIERDFVTLDFPAALQPRANDYEVRLEDEAGERLAARRYYSKAYMWGEALEETHGVHARWPADEVPRSGGRFVITPCSSFGLRGKPLVIGAPSP